MWRRHYQSAVETALGEYALPRRVAVTYGTCRPEPERADGEKWQANFIEEDDYDRKINTFYTQEVTKNTFLLSYSFRMLLMNRSRPNF